jgi:hypothetical protein
MAETVWIVSALIDDQQIIYSVHDTMAKADLMVKKLQDADAEYWPEMGEYTVE